MQKLEELILTENSLGFNGTKALVDSISSWGSRSPLRNLGLINCKISSGLELLKALTCCHQLYTLCLSHNPLAGSLKNLPSNLHLPSLDLFQIPDTSLTREDIQALAAVIQNKGMPNLRNLGLGYDKLNINEDSTLSHDLELERPDLRDESVETLHALKFILADSGLTTMISGELNEYTGELFVKIIDAELQRRT